MTFAPGRPDATMLQTRLVEGVHSRCFVYGPLGPGLLTHLDGLAALNARPDSPPGWSVDVRTGDDWFDRGLREQPGNVAVVAGRPADTVAHMLACVRAGLHVLAADPWVVAPGGLADLAEVHREAELRELVVWPLAANRYAPVVQLLLALVAEPEVCGGVQTGTPQAPAVVLEATRGLTITVADRAVRLPAWAFDPVAAGDALTAAGPLAELALRLVRPDRPPAPAHVTDVDGASWSGLLPRDQFSALTGLTEFPPALASQVTQDTLSFPANGTATCAIDGVSVRLSVLTEVDLPTCGYTLEATVLGRRATLTARSGGGPGEVVVQPTAPTEPGHVALTHCCQTLQARFPGLSVHDMGGRIRLAIPPAADGGFPELLADFVRFFRSPRQVPAWETAAALTVAHLTTAASVSANRK